MKMTPRSPNKVNPGASSSNMLKRKHKTYRSVITDVFDGKLNSSVQCLTCDRVSTTTETFQVQYSALGIYEAEWGLFKVKYGTLEVLPWS